MSYGNSVSLTSLEGGAWPPVTARLWMLSTVVGTGQGSGPQQLEQGSDSLTSAGSFPFSFPLGPDFSNVSKGIGVSLQDSPRVANDTGWWFRSGRFDGPLPTGPIEVVLLAPTDLTRADFAAALPTIPLAMSATRTITFLTVISGTELVVTAAGTTTELGAPVTFTCRLEFALSLSSSIAIPSDLFTLEFPHPPLVTFSAVPSNLASTAAAAALELLPGVKQAYRDFVAHSILPVFVRGLETRLVTTVLSTGLSGLIGPGVTTLPAEVILSLRSIEVTSPGLTVRGALGAFDGVFSKFPPPQPIKTGTCFIAAAATSEGSAEVLVLQDFRDTCLRPSRTGVRLVRLYERLSPALADTVRANRALAAVVRYLIVKPAASVAWLVTGASSVLSRKKAEKPLGPQ